MTHEEVVKKLDIFRRVLNPISRNGEAMRLAIESVKFDARTTRCKDCMFTRHLGDDYYECLVYFRRETGEDYCSRGKKR